MSKNIEGVGEVATPRTFKEKLSNFWYHYKLHSIVAAFLVVVLTVCSIQFCAKESYDVQVLYAGGKQLGKTAEDGDVAEIVKIMSALRVFAEDFNEDGEKSVNLTNYYHLSNEEIEALGDEVNYNLLSSDEKTLTDAMLHSEFYLCFMSIAAYEEYRANGGEEMFMPLDEVVLGHEGVELYSDCAILLSSTDAYKMPGMSLLPADTLICLKRPNALASKSSKHKAELNYATKMIENILNYNAE